MKHIAFILLGLFLILQTGGCQDHDFKVPISVISIQYPDGTIQRTASGTGIVDWASITNKPNFVALYKPIGYVPTWAEITGKPVLFSGNYQDLTNKPSEIDLQAAIQTLPGLQPPRLTQAQINALTPIEGIIVYNLTTHLMQYWNGSIWKIYTSVN